MPLDPVPTVDPVDLDPDHPGGNANGRVPRSLDPDVVLAAVLARSATGPTRAGRIHALVDRLQAVLPPALAGPFRAEGWGDDDRDHARAGMGAGLRGGPGGLAGRRLGVVVLVVAMAAGAVIIGMARSSQPPSRVGAALDEQLPRAGTAPAAAQKGGDAGTDTGAADRVTPSVSSPAAGTDKPGDVPVVLWVHAAGAVKAPGLYRVADGARVADLLNAAGGPADDADTDRINLAAPLADAMRVYVPHKGEQAPPAVVGTSGPGGDGASGGGEGAAATGGGSAGSATPSSPVDLNTATAAQLDTLPGVGPATAASIIAWRTEHGRFASVDDLLQVRGIGPSRMEQLRPLVSVS